MKHMIKKKQNIWGGMLLLMVGVLVSSTSAVYGARASSLIFWDPIPEAL